MPLARRCATDCLQAQELLAAAPWLLEQEARDAALAGERAAIVLDEPYWYNGQDNLIIEVEWAGGSGSFYTYKWDTGSARCVVGAYPGVTSGSVQNSMSQLMLTGTLELGTATFGAVKTVLFQ